MTISTDIIVGYPTETKEEFEETLQLVREIKPDVINIARFVPRPGTPAASMEGQIHGSIKKERSSKLREVHREVALERHQKWLGWQGEIIVDEKIKDGVCGRNYAYKPVVLSEDVPLGSKIKVKITEVKPYCLIGKLIHG